MHIKSDHSEASYAYAHHMGSGQRVPALAWAQVEQHRVELSGDQYPCLSLLQL